MNTRITKCALKALLFVAVLFLIVWTFATTAYAQGRNCAPREFVLNMLADNHGETRKSAGIGSGGVLVEVFANLESGSWTIATTTPAKTTCLVASGQSFEVIIEALPAKGDPT